MLPPDAAGQQPGVGAPISAVPDGFGIPQGNFLLRDLQKDVFLWAHDDTVESGATYRYKLRYRLKNPVYRSSAVADPKFARQFSLLSADSPWSDPNTVPPSVYAFLSSGGGTTAKFDVLRWQNGKWYEKSFTAEPGDVIGSKSKDGDVDYTTGYSLVDLKPDVVTHDAKVVLANASGDLITRSLRVDQSEIITTKKQVGYVEPPVAPKTLIPGATGPGVNPGGAPAGFSPSGPPAGFVPPGRPPGLPPGGLH
jgi:hypothetical protein